MTMTERKHPNDTFLDDLFAQVRQADVQPSDDLYARVMADAFAQVAPSPQVAAHRKPGLWDRIKDAVGGWPAMSGLAAATLAGVWIGVAPPTSVETLTAPLFGEAVSVSLIGSDLDFGLGDALDG